MPGTPYTRLTARGSFGVTGNAYEIWSFGFAIGHGGDLLTTAEMDAVTNLITTRFPAGAGMLGTRTRLEEVAFAHVDAAGVQDQPTYRNLVNIVGGAAQGQRPSQVALAVSLRGPAGVHPARGRFYLPGPQHSLDVDTGLLDAAQVQATANLWRGLIADIPVSTSDGVLAIDTKTGIVPVTEVRVGRVLDTMRSRRNQVLEAYQVGI